MAAGRTNLGQAQLQLAALVTTIAIAIVGGLVTGQHFYASIVASDFITFGNFSNCYFC